MYRLIVRRVLKTTVAQKQPSCHCYLQDGMLSDTSFQLFTRGRPTLNVRAFQEGADETSVHFDNFSLKLDLASFAKENSQL